MNKKTVFGIIIAFLLLASFIPNSIAQAEERMVIAPYRGQGGFSNEYFSVFFDEEGEASVIAKLVLVNTKDSALKQVMVEIPGTSVRMISAVQEAMPQQKRCNQWQDICLETEKDSCVRYEKKCISWSTYPSYNPVYYSLKYDSEKLSKSVKYTINLSEQVAAQESATIVIYYKAEGYSKKSFGVFNFDFETLKVDFDVNALRVAVNVQPNLYLKGSAARVDYRSNFAAISSSAEKLSVAGGVESSELSSISNSVQWQPGYVKQTSGLDPLESFHVTGEYSTSGFMLYKNWVLLGIIIALVIIALLYFAFKKLLTSMNKPLIVILSGFLSNVVLAGVWILLIVLMKGLRSIIGYRNTEIFFLLMIFLGVIVSLLIIFGPPIYFGLKYGAVTGLLVFVSFVVWAFIISIFIAIILAIINQSPITPMYAVGAVAEVAMA